MLTPVYVKKGRSAIRRIYIDIDPWIFKYVKDGQKLINIIIPLC